MADNAIGNRKQAVAQAPASVGNVAIGFDCLGHAIAGPVDSVVASPAADEAIELVVEGRLAASADSNTAVVAVRALLSALNIERGVHLRLTKGIPFAAGMGGSAASAVAAVVATNALLKRPLPMADLYPFAFEGEAVGSGSPSGDNVAASLLGGLVLVGADDHLTQLPVPSSLDAAVVHPEHEIKTQDARAVLPDQVDWQHWVDSQAKIASFVASLFDKRLDALSALMQDGVVEPARCGLIPGFDEVKRTAMAAQAICCSLSGAGPAMFAWADSEAAARRISAAMVDAFGRTGSAAQGYVTRVMAPGARVLSGE